MTELLDMLTAHYRFQFLAAGVHFKLFTQLAREPGLTREALAKRLHITDRAARALLLGCTSMRLVRKTGEQYFNSDAAGAALSEDQPGNVTDLVRWERHKYRGMSWFCEALAEDSNAGLREFPGAGGTLYERISTDRALEVMFQSAMSMITEAIAGEAAQVFDLSGYRHALDVGGGAAAVYPRTFASRWPKLRMTILDLPYVAEAARTRLAAEGLDGRMNAIALDCLASELPTDGDCILFSHFLEIWSDDRICTLLAKAWRALPSRGGLFIVTPTSNDEETGPWLAAHLAAYFQTIASSQGMVRTRRELDRWITDAGFEFVSQRSSRMNYYVQARKR
jgi:hypothetical protein